MCVERERARIMTDKRLTVCVCGGGNGGHVLAGLSAVHAQMDTHVLTLFQNEAADWMASMKNSDFVVTRKNKDGTIAELKDKPSLITNDPRQAVLGADIIILCVPAFAHLQYFQAIVPYLKRDVAIIGLPGQPGFEFQCIDVLKDKAKTCAILSYESLPWACRIAEFGKRVDILATKEELLGSKIPGNSNLTFDPVKALQSLIGPNPVLLEASNYLEISLMTKAYCHPAIMYGAWKDWDGEPLKEKPLFYQGLSKHGAFCMSAISDEIVETARAIGRLRPDLKMDKVEHIEPWFLRAYPGTVQDPTSIYTAMRTNTAYDGLVHPMKETPDGRWVPDFGQRYISEDIPFGLAVTKGLAEIAGVRTPVTDEVLAWCQDKMGKEYLVGSELKGKDVKGTRAPQAYGFLTLDDLVSVL